MRYLGLNDNLQTSTSVLKIALDICPGRSPLIQASTRHSALRPAYPDKEQDGAPETTSASAFPFLASFP